MMLLMLIVIVMKISVLTMLAVLLTSENLTFNGKMNLIFLFMFNIIMYKLVDCTVLITTTKISLLNFMIICDDSDRLLNSMVTLLWL